MDYTTASTVPYATAIPVPPPPIEYNQFLISQGSANDITEQQIRALVDQGYTRGLAKSFAVNNTVFPLRIWVIDNSGSMQTADGHRIVQQSRSKNELKLVDCTRWNEIKECINYHIQMAALLEAPTMFKLLNNPGAAVGPQEFEVASTTSSTSTATEVQNAINIMAKVKPGGATPLTEHLSEIYQIVDSLKPQLDATGKKVAIILATDGLPTDRQGISNENVKQLFVQSLRRLEGLPVWLVIRLCTDEDDVVDFYNSLDDQLELSMDVLDDICAEAEEVYEHNAFLNYALPLHRMREMGYHDRVLDMIDERKLTRGELRELCMLLFGEDNFDGVPDPGEDWKGFITAIKKMLEAEKDQWNPVKKKKMPWLNLKKMNSAYGDGSSCAIM